MGNLCIKHSITVYFKLSNKRTRIFTEIVEDFNDVSIFKNLFQLSWETIIHLSEIYNEAALTNPNL